MNLNKLTKLWYILLMVPFVLNTSCKKDEPAAGPIASFQYEVDAVNFLKVTFSNFSQNSVSYSWDFGDASTSTDENPVHEYAMEGTYTVTLTATGSDGTTTSVKSLDVEISDPDAQLTLLSGNVSKTWKLVREGAAVGIGPDDANWTLWWSLQNNGARNCLYDDSFIFHRDGTFEYDDAGTFFGEGDVFNNTDQSDIAETCFDATTGNMTVDGNDYSAWLSSNSHAYTFDATNKKITLTGTGAWMGLIKLGTDGYVTSPQESVTFDMKLTDGGDSGVDTLDVIFNYASLGNYWKARYVSYADPSVEPSLPVPLPNPGFTYVLDAATKTVTFTNTSTECTSYSWDFGDGSAASTETNPVHVYANDGIYNVVLTGYNSEQTTATKSESININIPLLADINFDFESTELTWSIFGGTDFNGAGMTLARVANPDASGINTSGFVMQIDQEASVQGWSGISTVLDGRVDFTNKQTFKVKVYSPAVGQIVKFKMEQTGDPNNNKEIDATTTVAGGWEELTFTFDAGDSGKWDVLVLFFDFQTDVKASATTYYFDDIVLQ